MSDADVSIDQIIGQLDLAKVSAELGEDPHEVRKAAYAAVPMLLGGMQANAQDPQKQVGLLGALDEHAQRDPASIDTSEGQKIATHLVGDPDQAVRTLGATGGTGAGADLVKKLLPYLAPIVLGVIAKKVGGKNAGALGTVLSSVLAGAASGTGAGTSRSTGGSVLTKIIEALFRKK